MRRLTPAEITLGREVFGDAVALERVRIARGGFGRFAVTLGSRLSMPPHLTCPDYAAGDLRLQALFIHELTHVWQFQTRAWWTLWSWARVAASGGYGPAMTAYRYDLPIGRFCELNLEQQASVVEHAFILTRTVVDPAVPPCARLEHYAGSAPFPVGLSAHL